MPALRTITSWHDDPNYIKALAGRISDFWGKHGRPDKLLMSFHGVPKFSLLKGDPYHCLCHVTARLLARELGLAESQWVLTFQSRFGRAEWLQPYTEATLKALPAQGVKRLHVVCPGFPADCLETLEEIAMEGKETFLHAGGAQYDYIPALNDHESLIRTLTELSLANLQGWLNAPKRHRFAGAGAARKSVGGEGLMRDTATITRRVALKRIGAVSSLPALAVLGGCAEFDPGYPPSATPRFARLFNGPKAARERRWCWAAAGRAASRISAYSRCLKRQASNPRWSWVRVPVRLRARYTPRKSQRLRSSDVRWIWV